MNLYEQQSSYNPNMPLRGFLYFSQLYSKYIEQKNLNIYTGKLQKIPAPKFVVFYNGKKKEPDKCILKLSDAFQTDNGCLECEATMLNINYGHNRELMEKCRRLEEYSIFVETVRKYTDSHTYNLSDAITLAIEECIEHSVLSDILIAQRAEVHMMILETFNKEWYERDLKEEAKEEGRQETLIELARDGILSVSEAAKRLNISEDEFKKLL